MERDAAKALSNEELLEILKTAPEKTINKLTEQLTYINEKVAITKTLLQKQKMVDTMQNTLDNAIKSGNDSMVEAIQKKIDAGARRPCIALGLGDPGLPEIAALRVGGEVQHGDDVVGAQV